MIQADDVLDRRLGLRGRRGRRRRPVVRVRHGCCVCVGASGKRRRRDAVVHRAPLRPRRAVAHARRGGARSCARPAAGRGRPARRTSGRVRRPRGKDGGAHRCRVHPARGRPPGRRVQRPGQDAAFGRGLAGDGRGVHRDRWIACGAPAYDARRGGGGGRRLSRTTGGGPGRRYHRPGRLAVRARLRPPGGRPPRAARRAPAPPPNGRRISAPEPDRGGRRSRRGGCGGARGGAPRARSPDRQDVRVRAKRRPRAREVAHGRGPGGGAALARCVRAVREARPDPRGRRAVR